MEPSCIYEPEPFKHGVIMLLWFYFSFFLKGIMGSLRNRIQYAYSFLDFFFFCLTSITVTVGFKSAIPSYAQLPRVGEQLKFVQ